MFSIIIIGLLIALVAVVTLGMLVFFDVAFANQTGLPKPSHQWQPPLMRGKELRDWAARMATAATTKWLSKPRGKKIAIGLTTEITHGASYAIAQSPKSRPQLAPNCRSCKRRMIGVTPPEAIAISETIRNTMPSPIARRIHAQAAQNANSVLDLDPNQYEQADITCPLWDKDTSCLVFELRPLHCRSCRPDPEKHDQVGALDAHAFSVGSGTEEGLSQGLQSEGLDGSVYELNSALATALEKPNAAEQWIEGDTVFNQCKLCQ
jgi:hypothetical protein